MLPVNPELVKPVVVIGVAKLVWVVIVCVFPDPVTAGIIGVMIC